MGAAATVTLTTALILALLLRRSVVQPISKLIDAMRRVREGDLDAHLAPVSADELGTVAQHFNAMVGGLQERERLAGENVALQDTVQAQLCLEALQNAAKHAGTEAHATISLAEEAGVLRFEVADAAEAARDAAVRHTTTPVIESS